MAATELELLEAALTELEVRASDEPRLGKYRVVAEGINGTEGVPDGWFVSRAIERLACEGGWWPGDFSYPIDATNEVVDIVTAGNGLRPGLEPSVRWAHVGSVWERDHFYTPMLTEPVDTAPLLGFSNQALWTSMVFPCESALLESFTHAYDVLGIGEYDKVDPFFVEWVVRPSPAVPEHDPEWAKRRKVHELLAAASKTWRTQHRCWIDSVMPRIDDDIWSNDNVGALLGIEPGELADH